MSTKLQIIILIVLVFVFLFMIFHICKKKLDFKFCLPWLLFIFVCIILTCFPQLLDLFSKAVGIETPVNTLFVCGFAISLFIIYTLTVAVSKLTANVCKLTQKIALLEKELAGKKEGNDNEK